MEGRDRRVSVNSGTSSLVMPTGGQATVLDKVEDEDRQAEVSTPDFHLHAGAHCPTCECITRLVGIFKYAEKSAWLFLYFLSSFLFFQFLFPF